jgi:hypothetical protein
MGVNDFLGSCLAVESSALEGEDFRSEDAIMMKSGIAR